MSESGQDIHELLDATLPEALRNVIRYGTAGQTADTQVVATVAPQAESQAQDPTLEVPNMAGENTQAPATVTVIDPKIDPKVVEQVVASKLAEIKKDENRDQAIANLVREAEGHKHTVASQKATIESLQKDLDTERAEAAKAKKAADEEEPVNNKFFKKVKADLETVTKERDELKAKLDEQAVTQAVATRKSAIEGAGIKNAAFIERATKVEANKLVMSEDDFTVALAMVKENASAATQQQTSQTQATASQQQAPAQTVPATPDLSGAGAYTQATASLVGGAAVPAPNADRAKFAAIGCAKTR